MTNSRMPLMHTMKNMAANKKVAGITKKQKRVIALILFAIYFATLFYFLFFSEKLGRTYSERTYHYNLVPFLEIKRFIQYYEVLGMKAVLLNIFGNIGAFVPFGMFLPMFSRRCRKIWYTIFYSFELSLFVELMQLVSKVGSFDVDDLILNTLGGFIGCLLYLGGCKAMKVWAKRKKH